MMPSVNLCVFNHPMAGITDQVFFVENLFSNLGYDLSISDHLRKDALNMTIENFHLPSAGFNFTDSINTFCQKFNKRIGIIMTEHIEISGTNIIFNGAPLTDATYIANKMSRFFGVLAHSQLSFGFFTLGSLPELNTFHEIFQKHALYRLPFPALDLDGPHAARGQDSVPDEAEYDAVFTGSMTPYRRGVLAKLGERFRILVSSTLDTEEQRAALYRRARVAVNIPQDASWGWISPMRVIFGLRVGRPTVHFGSALRQTEFDRAVPLDMDLSAAVADPAALYKRQAAGYDRLAREGANQFPDNIFRLWAALENLGDESGIDGDAESDYRQSHAIF